MTTTRLALVVGAGGAALLLLRFWRGLPWLLAGVVALAVAVLVWSSLRTGDRLRGIWRGR